MVACRDSRSLPQAGQENGGKANAPKTKKAPGRHPQPFPTSSPLFPAPFPVRSTSPPHLFLCMLRPTRVRRYCQCARYSVYVSHGQCTCRYKSIRLTFLFRTTVDCDRNRRARCSKSSLYKLCTTSPIKLYHEHVSRTGSGFPIFWGH